jgi:hypothetical protein
MTLGLNVSFFNASAKLDGMIDALCTYASIGATVRLGDFGSLRPGLNDFF